MLAGHWQRLASRAKVTGRPSGRLELIEDPKAGVTCLYRQRAPRGRQDLPDNGYPVLRIGRRSFIIFFFGFLV